MHLIKQIIQVSGKVGVPQGGPLHVKHTETEMKFVASDCGEVKPIAAPNASP